MLADLLADAREDFGLGRGELGEDLAVEADIGFLQLRDEGAVGLVPQLADGGVQADDPELTEDGLLVAAMGEGVAAGAHQGLVREVELLGAVAAIALGALEEVRASLECHHAAFDSGHTRVIRKG